MKNYLFKLGLQAKKASNKTIKSKKKEQVLKDYCNLLLKISKRTLTREKSCSWPPRCSNV